MNNKITALARTSVLALTPYQSARDEFRGQASLYLDANENPYATGFNRYPDAQQQRLKEAVAKLKKVSPAQLLLTNGSDEAIDLLIRAFCNPGKDTIIIPQPTYGMYATYAAINEVSIKTVNLKPDFTLDMDAVQAALTPSTKMIFLCSPNNPSGNLLAESTVISLLNNFKGLVVVDEAYIDFTGKPGWIRQLGKHGNLVLLHTFSKAWGLAGLRLGACVADPEVIELLNKIKPPYNISSYSERRVIQEITSNRSKVKQRVDMLIRERKALTRALSQIPTVKHIYPSDANFLLVKVRDAKTAYRKLIEQGIVVRNRSGMMHCDNCLRITVGTPIQNRRLIKAMNQL